MRCEFTGSQGTEGSAYRSFQFEITWTIDHDHCSNSGHRLRQRQGNDRHFSDRRMSGEHLFDFGGIYFQSADIELNLRPPRDLDPPIGMHSAKIAGPKMAL